MKFLNCLGTLIASMAFCACTSNGGDSVAWNTPGAGNPLLPGYFADPTIKKFGDTYYIYATTDGTGNGYGPAQVWMSKDFVNWKNVTMNWPTTEVVWAPDVVQQPDGTYRYYYCTPCVIYVGESDSPVGPWKNRLGAPDAVLVEDRFVHNAITLDPQLFVDDDGSEYLYFGTWGIYEGFGCGVAKLAEDGKSFTDKKLILNTEIKDFFEAPFVFKKDGIYYFTYSSGSCHDHTYRVQYATSTEGPMGPYEYKGCILEYTEDMTIQGTGHHSMLVDGDNYYIVYHRHGLPKSLHGFNRQVCIDEVKFDENGNIKKINPTHSGVLPASLVQNAQVAKFENLAFGAKVTASSFYNEWFKPEYATDDNNATLWRAKSCHEPASITIDLGQTKKFNQIWTQFEYTTFFYQYKIETSDDNQNWSMYADKTDNVYQGSPMIDEKDVEARYIRITITDTQKNGHFPAIWNVKVYQATEGADPKDLLPDGEVDEEALLAGYPWIHQKDVEEEEHAKTALKNNLIVDINADDYGQGKTVKINQIDNRVGGAFLGDEPIVVEVKDGKYGFFFNGQKTMKSNFGLPSTMISNAPYTITAWTLNPSVSAIETVAEFSTTRNDFSALEFRQGSDESEGLISHIGWFENAGAPNEIKNGEGKWQHWVITFDGYTERVYLNGNQILERNMFLLIRPSTHITLGASMDGSNKFSGYVHSLQFYDKGFTAEEVKAAYAEKSDTDDKASFSGELTLKTRVVSPNLIDITVVEPSGEKVESGLLSFKYAVSSNQATDEVTYSESTNNSSSLLATDGKGNQICFVNVVDDSGEYNKVLKAEVSMPQEMFSTFNEDASDETMAWDGMNLPKNAGYEIENGALKLTSAGTNFNTEKSENGVLLYKEVKGDFVMQAKVVGMAGEAEKTSPAYNEGGILVLDDSDAHGQHILQIGAFPSYNCGNMLTLVSPEFGRPQFSMANGWEYAPYMQIERIGNVFHVRVSHDGVNWANASGSPVEFKEMAGKTLKVGCYHTTYSDNEGWVMLDDFYLWQKK